MKKFKHYKLSAVLAACLGTSLVVATAQAGEIDADLQQAMQTGADVDFIVQFSDQLDLSGFPGKGKGKGKTFTLNIIFRDLKPTDHLNDNGGTNEKHRG